MKPTINFYKLRALLLLITAFVYYTVGVHAAPTDDTHSHKTDSKFSKEINALLEQSEKLAQQHNIRASDSIIQIAIAKSELHGDDAITIKAYWKYFSRQADYSLDLATADEYSKNILSIAKANASNKWNYFAYTAQTQMHLQNNELEIALQKVSKANYYVNLLDNSEYTITNYLLWGKCQERNNNKIDAFRNYLNALYLSEKIQDNELVARCNNHLSEFYLLIGNYERARAYKLKEINISEDADSSLLTHKYADLARVLYYNKEYTKAEKITSDILKYAYQNNDRDLVSRALRQHRTYLIENGLLNELATFYTIQHPDELGLLHTEDTLTYYRTMAFISEAGGDNVAANSFYQNAENYLDTTSNNNVLLSNIYKRYGQFLLRTNNINDAITKMRTSFDYAKKASYLPYLVEVSAVLDSLYHLKGNYPEAYAFSSIYKKFAEKSLNTIRQDDLLQMEIDNESKQRKLKTEQELEETERRHNLQYMIIVIAIIIIFLILILLGSFKVPRFVITALGFFSFIFLFEFIILLLDHKIMEITHHEPWKMLALKVILISFLLPFHHWIEHKAVHYLIEKKLMNRSNFSIKNLLARSKKAPIHTEKP